ncbi:MAG: flagellar assembly regulator FliX [Methyloligellaceae bacterium]
MRVNTARTTSSATSGKPLRRAGGSSAAFEPSRGQPARKAAALRGAAAVSTIDAILALQGVDDATERRRKALRQGEQVLDSLEGLKIALLTGRIDAEKLERLQALVAQYEEIEDEPELAAILRQIDLRARVELAKLRR